MSSANKQVSGNIMKISYLNYLIILLLIGSCETKQFLNETKAMTNDAAVAAEIVSEIGGTGYSIFFSTSENYLTDDTTRYVVLKVNGDKFLQFSQEKKFIYASYCATQLYKRLDPAVISINSAIKVIFNDEEDIFDDMSFYFEKSELENAWLAFKRIDNYLMLLLNNDSTGAMTQIDTTYSQLDFHSINRQVKARLGNSIIRTDHMYDRREYSNTDSTKKANCFSISTQIYTADSTAIYLGFLVPISEAGNKIINIHPEG